MVTKRRLYGEDGIAILRSEKTAADAPASGSWTPDNLNALEITGGLVADDVTLDAREWESANLYIDFVDGSGDPHDGGTMDVALLLAVPDSAATSGRRWKLRQTISALGGTMVTNIPLDGHDVAVRIDAVALGGATSGTIKVTGGRRLRGDIR